MLPEKKVEMLPTDGANYYGRIFSPQHVSKPYCQQSLKRRQHTLPLSNHNIALIYSRDLANTLGPSYYNWKEKWSKRGIGVVTNTHTPTPKSSQSSWCWLYFLYFLVQSFVRVFSLEWKVLFFVSSLPFIHWRGSPVNEWHMEWDVPK